MIRNSVLKTIDDALFLVMIWVLLAVVGVKYRS